METGVDSVLLADALAIRVSVPSVVPVLHCVAVPEASVLRLVVAGFTPVTTKVTDALVTGEPLLEESVAV